MSNFLRKCGPHMTYAELERAIHSELGVNIPAPMMQAGMPTRDEIEKVTKDAEALRRKLKDSKDNLSPEVSALQALFNKVVSMIPPKGTTMVELSGALEQFERFRKDVTLFKEEADLLFDDDTVTKMLEWDTKFPLLLPRQAQVINGEPDKRAADKIRQELVFSEAMNKVGRETFRAIMSLVAPEIVPEVTPNPKYVIPPAPSSTPTPTPVTPGFLAAVAPGKVASVITAELPKLQKEFDFIIENPPALQKEPEE